MLPIRFVGRLWHFAFSRFALRTDGMQVVAALAAPLVGQWLDIINPDEVGPVMLGWIAYAALCLLLIRILVAPYYVWKEERTRADALQCQLDAPGRIERETMASLRAQKKMELIEAVRQAHMVLIDDKQDKWDHASTEMARLEGVVSCAAGVKGRVRRLMRMGDEIMKGNSPDYSALSTEVESLITEVYNA